MRTKNPIIIGALCANVGHRNEMNAHMHTIVTLLTTFSVTLHAMLGCCAHHSHGSTHNKFDCVHSSSSRKGSEYTTAIPSKVQSCCSHGHHHAVQKRACGEPADKSLRLSFGVQSDESKHQHHGICNEPDCSFAFIERISDVGTHTVQNLDLNPHFAVLVSASINARGTDYFSFPRQPPDLKTRSLSLRAHFQIWQL